jgi:hypothetical protein
LKSLVISLDYQSYMGSSARIWSLWWFFLYLCSYNLDDSVTAILIVKPECKNIYKSSLKELLKSILSAKPQRRKFSPTTTDTGSKNIDLVKDLSNSQVRSIHAPPSPSTGTEKTDPACVFFLDCGEKLKMFHSLRHINLCTYVWSIKYR